MTAPRSAKLAALAMIVVALTQVAYITLKGEAITGPMIWSLEAIAFLAITLLALVPLARGAAGTLGWAALALFGLFNVVQTGMGLTMFGPVGDAGEALAPVMDAIVGGAFFFYFAGKVMVGIAGLALGAVLLREAATGAKAVGGLAALTGLAALLVNLAGLLMGMDMVFAAGATGTAATVFTATAIWMLAGRQEAR
ncbi:MAG: hypothetical protein ACR2FJ_04740 [Qipengyuania sp.]